MFFIDVLWTICSKTWRYFLYPFIVKFDPPRIVVELILSVDNTLIIFSEVFALLFEPIKTLASRNSTRSPGCVKLNMELIVTVILFIS